LQRWRIDFTGENVSYLTVSSGGDPEAACGTDWRCCIEPQRDYRELRIRLAQAGAFEPQPVYYVLQVLFTLSLLVLSGALLFVWESLWLRLTDAVLLAFAMVQIGFIFHDAGHRQIFRRARDNDIVMLLTGFIVGSSRSWWFDSHNRHHAHPNEIERDPDTELYVVNFSERQARGRTWLVRQLTRFQAYYFFPVLALEGVGVHIVSIAYLIRSKARYRLIEAAGLALHLGIYAGVLLLAMPWWQVGLFVVVHHCIAGLYMGSVFAPNHKGMLVPDADCGLDLFHRQVLTSRNVRPGPLVDVWYGGLNYQIEHHLFPMIPRSKLKTARTVVKQYCAERGVAYHETSVWQSFVEITAYLHGIVTPRRAERAAVSTAAADGR
jgi:fatty acid desaturase